MPGVTKTPQKLCLSLETRHVAAFFLAWEKKGQRAWRAGRLPFGAGGGESAAGSETVLNCSSNRRVSAVLGLAPSPGRRAGRWDGLAFTAIRQAGSQGHIGADEVIPT